MQWAEEHGYFFFSSYLFINSSFFFLLVSRPVDSTRPDQHFFLSGNGGDAFCPILVLKNAPGTLQTPRGRYFEIILWNAPGGVYSVLYGMYIPRIHLQGHHGMFTMSVLYHHTSSPPTVNMHINRCVAVAVQERLWTLTLRRTFSLPLLCLDWPSFDEEGSQEDIHLILRFRYILSVSHMSTVYQ